jgi:hypothetical protein
MLKARIYGTNESVVQTNTQYRKLLLRDIDIDASLWSSDGLQWYQETQLSGLTQCRGRICNSRLISVGYNSLRTLFLLVSKKVNIIMSQ